MTLIAASGNHDGPVTSPATTGPGWDTVPRRRESGATVEL
jgi:hypothetical protein